MTATRAEIVRVLPPELAAGLVDGRVTRGSSPHGAWELELIAAPPLRVGPLQLEVTELVIRLRGYSPEQRARFLARLEQYTRRGGG
jgi:hypothetical protein